MMEKLNEYTGGYWRIQALKDAWKEWREGRSAASQDPENNINDSSSRSWTGRIRDKILLDSHAEDTRDFSHLTRRKTRMELVLISAVVMGIEFCYAAETAFVSPTLLSIGVEHRHMTLIWCLSPLVGFFVTPVLGSMSDRCRGRLGRRRPFILLLSVGILLGLILVPNGKLIGQSLGDEYLDPPRSTNSSDIESKISETDENLVRSSRSSMNVSQKSTLPDFNKANFSYPLRDADNSRPPGHPWGILFTIIGTMLLDFSSDACQSPSRAFLLDITVPEDHTRGLSTFTIMAGLGGAFGYMMGGTNWDTTWIGHVFGGHVRAVFTLVVFIYLFCLLLTMISFDEQPLSLVQAGQAKYQTTQPTITQGESDEDTVLSHLNEHAACQTSSYGATQVTDPSGDVTSCVNDQQQQESSFSGHAGSPVINREPQTESGASLRHYLTSIVRMPSSLRHLCLTNLFCWMSLVCYSLYFTDFVGEAVFGGDPQAPVGSSSRERYESGVRFGCWGLCVYSLSCSVYSFLIEKLVRRFKARPVYVGGQLIYSFGMVLMAALRHPAAVIVFSLCAGVMYSTLFTMPYLLVARYHVCSVFDEDDSEKTNVGSKESQLRGLGTDVAIVSSMVFLAQFVLSICLGWIIAAAGTTTMVVVMAAVLSFCGAISATQVTYLDL